MQFIWPTCSGDVPKLHISGKVIFRINFTLPTRLGFAVNSLILHFIFAIFQLNRHFSCYRFKEQSWWPNNSSYRTCIYLFLDYWVCCTLNLVWWGGVSHRQGIPETFTSIQQDFLCYFEQSCLTFFGLCSTGSISLPLTLKAKQPPSLFSWLNTQLFPSLVADGLCCGKSAKRVQGDIMFVY